MKNYQSQSHVTWECKYNRVWCPKYRQKKLYGKLRGCFGGIAHALCHKKGVELIEGDAKPDHVHQI
ncbi:MAG: IS200/IS605 family transposase [Deltaproteobacteria bacterium]|nr:IS200/IS605 family transposase [Deltaproteobacteria bacterium]